MTAWTTIPNTSLESGAPIRGVDGVALRDNPIAIAEGATGAPKIQAAAFDDLTIGAEKLQNGTTERDWIISLISSSVYSVGSYLFAAPEATNTDYSPGSTISGSFLNPASSSLEDGQSGTTTGTGVSGTWRCMGYSENNAVAPLRRGATLWKRIA